MVPLAEFGPTPRFILSPGDKGDAPKVSGFRAVAAWNIQHSDSVRARFTEVSALLGNVQTLFHGTRAHNIQDIAKEGLRPGRKSCMFGSGIYMGEINKAFNYAGGSEARYIIKVQAALGKVLEAEKAHTYSRRSLVHLGFDSVAGVAGRTASWGGTLLRTEYVAYSPDQVLALKVYEYQAVKEQFIFPKNGACVVLVEKNVPLPKGSSAFRDILRKQPCGAQTYTRLKTDAGHIWVCANCISTLKLKIGSKVEVKRASSQYSLSRSAIQETVRITGTSEPT
jgi:hypothetical protein